MIYEFENNIKSACGAREMKTKTVNTGASIVAYGVDLAGGDES